MQRPNEANYRCTNDSASDSSVISRAVILYTSKSEIDETTDGQSKRRTLAEGLTNQADRLPVPRVGLCERSMLLSRGF